MPQYPLGLNTVAPGGAAVPNLADPNGALIVNNGGTEAFYNITTSGLVVSGPGTLDKVSIIGGGTASNGQFKINDAPALGSAGAANLIADIPSGASAGTVVALNWPISGGVVVSTVPTAGSPIIALTFRPAQA